MRTDEKKLACLYESVLDKEHGYLDRAEIMHALKEIRKTYKRIHSDEPISLVDYNSNEYRFAYIYLYAVCHTATVREHVNLLETSSPEIFRDMLKLGENRLSVCSLGGGPGCEIIGILCGLGRRKVEPSRIDCSVLDTCMGWSQCLTEVVESFVKSDLGKRYKGRMNCRFVNADLCSVLSTASKFSIQKADLVTMVKFVSVVSYYCRDNSYYLKAIFNLMKPGSYLFFLDNCTGGFFEMVSKVAEENGFILLFQQKTHYHQGQNVKFSKYKFSVRSLQSTSVIFAVWKKKELHMCICL